MDCIGGSCFLWKKKGIKKGLGFGKKSDGCLAA